MQSLDPLNLEVAQENTKQRFKRKIQNSNKEEQQSRHVLSVKSVEQLKTLVCSFHFISFYFSLVLKFLRYPFK